MSFKWDATKLHMYQGSRKLTKSVYYALGLQIYPLDFHSVHKKLHFKIHSAE